MLIGHVCVLFGEVSIQVNGSAFWASNPTSRNISEETQHTNSEEHMHPYVHGSIIYNLQDMGAAQVPMSGWVDKKPWDI